MSKLSNEIIGYKDGKAVVFKHRAIAYSKIGCGRSRIDKMLRDGSEFNGWTVSCCGIEPVFGFNGAEVVYYDNISDAAALTGLTMEGIVGAIEDGTELGGRYWDIVCDKALSRFEQIANN